MMKNIRVFLNAKEEDQIKAGFPWIFDNEIGFVKADAYDDKGQHSIVQSVLKETKAPDGSIVQVFSKSGMYLGTGVFNNTSKITVRLLTRGKIENEQFNQSFFDKKIQDALDLRLHYFSLEDSFRLVFAEADFLPGLIVEHYRTIENRTILVVQFLALACEKFRKEIINSLRSVIKPYGIYERSDASVREKEGLELSTGWIGGESNPLITISENSVLLQIDLAHGQKTGYFLDQKFNRKAAASLCKGKRVLDAFSHVGAFGLHAFSSGAREVVCVDISEEASAAITVNAGLNKAGSSVRAVCADVFDYLKEAEQKGEKFDVIILDPPAFTKSAKDIKKAYGGYKEINLRAMKILSPGGILVTCSCSHFFDANTFYSMLDHASSDAHKNLQILEKRFAAPDHPVLSGYSKSEYLKCVIAKIT
jgi:23S rRNA (cytosine1962-C5)-methyltransferase